MRKQGRSRARRRSRDPRGRSSGRVGQHHVRRAFEAVAAGLGLLLVATQLVDWLEGRGATKGVQIPGIAVSLDVAEQAYLRETGSAAPPSESEGPEEVGTGMTARIHVIGYAGATLAVRWTLYDATTGRRVPGPRWRQVFARRRPDRDIVDETARCWVPSPERAGIYYVVIEVLAEDGRILAARKTQTFITGGDALRR
jgi:hypothetical protein